LHAHSVCIGTFQAHRSARGVTAYAAKCYVSVPNSAFRPRTLCMGRASSVQWTVSRPHAAQI